MPHRNADDDGFSVVELIIAMFLLAVLALAVLPLLIGATQTSAVNKSLVAATTFANAQLAPIRSAYSNDSTTSSCASLTSTYAKTGVSDPAGTGLKADISVSACPSSYPGTVTVTVKVYKASDTSKILATVPTKFVVAKS